MSYPKYGSELLRPPAQPSRPTDHLPYRVWQPFCGTYRVVAGFRHEFDAVAYRNLIVDAGAECWLQTPMDVYHSAGRVAS